MRSEPNLRMGMSQHHQSNLNNKAERTVEAKRKKNHL